MMLAAIRQPSSRQAERSPEAPSQIVKVLFTTQRDVVVGQYLVNHGTLSGPPMGNLDRLYDEPSEYASFEPHPIRSNERIVRHPSAIPVADVKAANGAVLDLDLRRPS